MKQIVYPVAVALAIAAAPSFAQQKLTAADARYFNQLAMMSMAEIEAARVAASRAHNAEVMHLARKILVEHEQELDELQQIAARKRTKMPTGPNVKQRAALERLQSMAGAQFDKAYIDQMVKDHDEADKLSQNVARHAQDPDLKALAKKTSSRMKEHLLSVRRVDSLLKAASMGGVNSSAGSSTPESGAGAKSPSGQ